MRKLIKTTLIVAILGLSAVALATTPASLTKTPAQTAPKGPVTHLWNLQDVDIKSVIAEISRETGKNFIIDPQVQGKITIISSHPMGPKESYEVFLSSLRVLGYSVVPDGDNLKVVPSRDAANQARLASLRAPGNGDEAVVRVIPVYYVSAMQLMPVLRPLLPTWGNLTAYSPSNAIILSGSADNVDRIAKIIAQVDTPESNGIDIVRLKHAVADDIVQEVNRLVLAARANGSSTTATLSSDPQSNSVMIGGDQVSRLRLKVLIAKLDSEDATGNNNTQVIYLKYIQVKDLLPILKGMVNQSVSYSMSSGAANYSSGGGSSTGGNTLGQASPQFMAAANSQLNNASLNSGSAAPANGDNKNVITIVGDVTNNALVITANPTVMMQLRTVISQLDVPPRQVLVESVIAEVDAQTAKQMGIEWGTSASSSSVAGAVTSNYSYTGGGMGVGFIQAGDMQALVAMLASDTNSNIVSTPSITVLNNTPADIEVGVDVSQVSAEYTGATDPSNPSILPPTTYTDKQIGLTLKVIPQITGDHAVRLVIDQENSAIVNDASVQGTNPNPPTSDEKISTQVLVNDGQVLVLGGLISSQDDEVVHKVPILGDIPLLGRLFQSHRTSKVKKDLMIFLRPVIVDNQQQSQDLTEKRYDFMRDVAILNENGQGNLIANSTLPAREPPALPTPFTVAR